MYDSATDHPRIKGSHRVLTTDQRGCGWYCCEPKRYDRTEGRRAIAEGLAEYEAECFERALEAMTEHERELVLVGRDRTMEGYAAWTEDLPTQPVRPNRVEGARKALIAAAIDLEERAFRRDEVIHFAGLRNKRRAAKRRPSLKGEPFDPNRVSRTLSPQFVGA